MSLTFTDETRKAFEDFYTNPCNMLRTSEAYVPEAGVVAMDTVLGQTLANEGY